MYQYHKTKKTFLWSFSFLFAMLTITPMKAMSEPMEDCNQLKITQMVIREIISTLPLSIKNICVLEEYPDQPLKPLKLNHVDNRISIDHDICDNPFSVDPSNVAILFIKDANTRIRLVNRPKGSFGEVYDKVINHLDSGDIIASAGLAKCGADINVYIFRISENSPHLIESVVIGTVECATK